MAAWLRAQAAEMDRRAAEMERRERDAAAFRDEMDAIRALPAMVDAARAEGRSLAQAVALVAREMQVTPEQIHAGLDMRRQRQRREDKARRNDAILRRAAEGHSNAAIAAWLTAVWPETAIGEDRVGEVVRAEIRRRRQQRQGGRRAPWKV
jgi:hypothetical protein